jgi:hypothetical protein
MTRESEGLERVADEEECTVPTLTYFPAAVLCSSLSRVAMSVTSLFLRLFSFYPQVSDVL